MERLRRIDEFWSWLPAFRAVAEAQHLPTAAEMLRVGPSALSRSVRLLEARLGLELFERNGRSLRLTPAGEELLRAVRDAMRRLDDGVEAVLSPSLRGELRLAAEGTLAPTLMLPALRRLRAMHPALGARVEVGVSEHAAEQLLRGHLDLVLQTGALAHPEICCVRLMEVELGVFCGTDHPLFGSSEWHEPARLGGFDFVVPPGSERGGISVDGWPVEWPRQIGLTVDQVRSGCDACAAGSYLAVLPVALASRCAPELWRLTTERIPRVTAFALHRVALGEERRADVQLVELLRAVAAEQAPGEP